MVDDEMGFTILLENDSSSKASGDVGKMGKRAETSLPKSSFDPLMSTEIVTDDGTTAPGHQPNSVSSLDEMFDQARDWVGHPYLSPSLVMRLGEQKAQQIMSKRTGSEKRAIDCSGFVQEVLGYAGVDPPGDQTAEGLFNYFKTNGRKLKTPERGSVIFFEPLEKSAADSGKWDAGRSITHVAMSLGDGRIIDSSGSRGVTERALPPAGRYKYHYFMPNYRFEPKGSAQ